MGRPPISGRAMTGKQRQAKYMAKLRRRPPSAPPPAPPEADEPTVRAIHLVTAPEPWAAWFRYRFGNQAARALRDALDRTLRRQ
jgi:hypothetical protein